MTRAYARRRSCASAQTATDDTPLQRGPPPPRRMTLLGFPMLWRARLPASAQVHFLEAALTPLPRSASQPPQRMPIHATLGPSSLRRPASLASINDPCTNARSALPVPTPCTRMAAFASYQDALRTPPRSSRVPDLPMLPTSLWRTIPPRIRNRTRSFALR
ncbi:hypothetical protein C8J57DRAFT_1308120 [Mycena rebaudengoi]|nr:hypothetical protein C8J57DRAFT_1308120 [Mycena rebaudengoi]